MASAADHSLLEFQFYKSIIVIHKSFHKYFVFLHFFYPRTCTEEFPSVITIIFQSTLSYDGILVIDFYVRILLVHSLSYDEFEIVLVRCT